MSDVPVESAAPAAAPAAAIPEVTVAPAEVDASSKRPRSPTPPPTTTASSSTAEASTSASMSDPKKAKLETPALTEEELAMNAPAPALPAPNAGRGSSAARGKKPARKWDGKDRLPGTGPGRMSRNARDIEDAAIIAAGGTPEKREGAEPRLPKKKTVVMLGFSGTGRKGMQIQKDKTLATIEGILFEAMAKAGAVSKDNADDSGKVSLARAARTDAGVHAAGNVVSLKMITEIPGVDDVAAHINSFLPSDVRIWGWVRVNSGFNARLACDSRVYEYLLPSHILLPPKPTSTLAAMLKKNTAAEGSAPFDPAEHPFWKENGVEGTWQEDNEKRKAWRIDSETVERAREAIKRYEGTHNFHNFTVERSFNDRASQRYMIKMDLLPPVVVNSTEWLSFRFHGQSFMLHQIRKMISLVILATRTATPTSLIPQCFGPRQIHVPKAPALGLLLEQPIFESHNANVKKGMFEGAKEGIDFGKYKDEMEAFKLREIYERLREEEESTDTFAKWITSIDNSAHVDEFAYLNPQGTIPASAVRVPHKKGSGPAPKRDDESGDEEVDAKALKSGELEG